MASGWERYWSGLQRFPAATWRGRVFPRGRHSGENVRFEERQCAACLVEDYSQRSRFGDTL